MARTKKEKKLKIKIPKQKLSIKHKNGKAVGGSGIGRRRRRRNFSQEIANVSTSNTMDPAPCFYIDTNPTTEALNADESQNSRVRNTARLSRKQKRRIRNSMPLSEKSNVINKSGQNTTENSLVSAASNIVADNTANSSSSCYISTRGGRHLKNNKLAADKVRQKWRKYTKERLKKSSLLALAGVSPRKTAETKAKIFRLLGDKSYEFGELNSTDEHDANLLQDLDLVILAASAADYEAYTKLLRQEYASLNEESYKQMRLKVLETLLMIPNIFSTPEYQAKFEAAARNNIKWEINSLKTQGN